jgi:outer membrane autotransporter protein
LAGTLALVYQPGTYTPRTYPLISVTGSTGTTPTPAITGGFSTVTGMVPSPGLTQSVVTSTSLVQPAGQPFTFSTSEVDLVLASTQPSVPMTVAPANATVFSSGTTLALLNGHAATSILLDRLGARHGALGDGSQGDGPLALGDGSGLAAPLHIAQNSNVATLGDAAAALPLALGGEGAWFRGIGSFTSLNSSAAAPGFNGTTGGFLAGFDHPVAPDLYLGAAAGYLHSDIGGAAGNGQINSGRFALYGGGWLGPNLLTGTVGYALDRISTTRTVPLVGTPTEEHDGHEFSIGAQWSLPIPVAGFTGSAVVTPKAGI